MDRFCVFAAVIACAMSTTQADDKQAVALNEKEQAFVELMQDAVLVGNFTVNKEKPGTENGKLTPERYGIKSITKLSDDQWTVNSQIKYGQLDVTVPVPVQVHFANDTPVLSVTDLTIPLVGDGFTARVMFFDNQYAGTWRHGKVGGLMYGRVEKAKPAAAGETPPKEQTEQGAPKKAEAPSGRQPTGKASVPSKP